MSVEDLIETFWSAHPCGDQFVPSQVREYEEFFTRYDTARYALERHILGCLDTIDFKDKETLEIGLGQGADSEQLIRRGARWSGLDLTQESIDRVRARFAIRGLEHRGLEKGSVLEIPYPDRSFDIVYSHGVLHHVPDILAAQSEIARVLRRDGVLVVMLYAKRSLNYQLAISVVRRLGLLGLALRGARGSGIYAQHLAEARKIGLWRYLAMEQFIHRNTDGPLNPYSKVYSRGDIARDFPKFRIQRLHKEFMHAPPLPVHGLPGARWLGWHLWAHMGLR